MDFKKTWDELTESEVKQIHLGGNDSTTTDFRIISTTARMFREAMHAANNNHSNIFLPSMACLAILDQVGTSYAITSVQEYPDPQNNVSGIKKAAYYLFDFNINDDSTKTLYSFRNGVMHESSFTNFDVRASVHYWFQFDSDMPKIVKPATTPWDGILTNQTDNNCSFINPRQLLSATEAGLMNLESALTAVKHPQGLEGIKTKYLLRLPR
jgi:hypothetical protein